MVRLWSLYFIYKIKPINDIIKVQWLNAKIKMQIEKCEMEAIYQNSYYSSQDKFAICTLQSPFCNEYKTLT